MQEKFCVNCAFCQIDINNTNLSTCHRHSAPKRDPVTGEVKKIWCNIERQGDAGCGAEGRHYVEMNTMKPSEAKEAFDRMFHGDGDFDVFGRSLKQGS
jgi:hypothetical protein